VACGMLISSLIVNGDDFSDVRTLDTKTASWRDSNLGKPPVYFQVELIADLFI
jgi:hypothetical protein